MSMPKRFVLAVPVLGLLGGLLGGSVATGRAGSPTNGYTAPDATGQSSDNDSGQLFDDGGGSQKPVASLMIDPPTATLGTTTCRCVT